MANKEFSEGSLKIMDWHAQSSADVIKTLKTNEKNGLSSAEAKKRLEKYGKNRLHEPKKPSLFAKFIAQFSDFMVLILLAAAGVSFVTAIIEGTGDFIDPIMILLIVVINAVTGVIQENRAEKAIEALKGYPHHTQRLFVTVKKKVFYQRRSFREIFLYLKLAIFFAVTQE